MLTEKRSIKGVFFDLHGTLLLSKNIDKAWEDWAQAFYQAMLTRGAFIDYEQFLVRLENLFNSPEPTYYESGLTLFERRVKELSVELCVEVPSNSLRPLVDHIIKVWHRGMFMDPEALNVLESLKKTYRIGLITNWEHTPRVYELLDEFRVNHLFDVVIVSDEVGVAKPDPEIFCIALRMAGVNPEEAVYVGDMDVDVKGSLSVGVHPILIQRDREKGEWDQFSNKVEYNYDSKTVTRITRLSDLLELLPYE